MPLTQNSLKKQLKMLILDRSNPSLNYTCYWRLSEIHQLAWSSLIDFLIIAAVSCKEECEHYEQIFHEKNSDSHWTLLLAFHIHVALLIILMNIYEDNMWFCFFLLKIHLIFPILIIKTTAPCRCVVLWWHISKVNVCTKH